MNTDADSGLPRTTLCTSPLSPLLSIALSMMILGCAPLSASSSQEDSAPYRSQIAIAEHELDSSHFARAASVLSRLLQADSHLGADVYRLLAFAQFRQNETYEALATCEKGIVIYPDSKPLTEFYVSVLHKAVSGEDLHSRLEIAIQWAPDSPAVAKALGEDLLTANSTDPRALQLLSHASDLSPRDAEAHFFFGESACFSQTDDVCIRELRRAHELDPDNQQANMQLFTMIAVTEDKQNQPERAASDFGLAMNANKTLSKPSPYAALKYATFLSAQNKHEQAMDIINEILRWDPSYGPAHFERAKYFSDRGKKQEAITEAELALQYPQNSPEQQRSYHYFLAKTYFALGRQSEAQVHQDWIESHPQP
jgi:tetratricopeptide (TPR) repeat protein